MTIYHLLFETTQGNFKVELNDFLAKKGCERVIELVKDNFYTDIPIHRCSPGFLCQFGITSDETKKHWHTNSIEDDKCINVLVEKYSICFAGSGPNTRSTQLFIPFRRLNWLGEQPWETPLGKVIEGEDVIDLLQGKDINLNQPELLESTERCGYDVDFINKCSIIEVIN